MDEQREGFGMRERLQVAAHLIVVVDPKRRSVEVRTPDGQRQLLTESDEFTGGDVLPGFRIPVARIFRWLT